MRLCVGVVVLCWLLALPGVAAEINVTRWRGHVVISMDGVISRGDAHEIEKLLPRADLMPYGVPIVLLSGPGGDVHEALLISKVFDKRPVHTVIPAGSQCASACASIVFVAGQYRTMEDGAAFGQHSCSINGIADPKCNAEIASHAVNHGVSHGSIAAFVTYVPPSEILWFSREDAEGWGLTKYPGETMSGFEKSEPRAIKLLLGRFPEAQSKWRIGFRDTGFDAFVRTVSDVEREMQINMFCIEDLPGRLFFGMEINGDANLIKASAISASILTDVTREISTRTPAIYQKDNLISEIVVEVPKDAIVPLLKKADSFEFNVYLRKPYLPLMAHTYLADSRQVLLFAANNCVR